MMHYPDNKDLQVEFLYGYAPLVKVSKLLTPGHGQRT